MKKTALLTALLAASSPAFAVQGTIQLNWTNPTTTTPPASLPLTGANALTETQFVVSKSPIPATFSGTPTFILTTTVTTTGYTMDLSNGDTVYVRMRSCNKPTGVLECSSWTNEVSRPVSFPTTPSMPTNVTINITIG